jgi:hypothetical protein
MEKSVCLSFFLHFFNLIHILFQFQVCGISLSDNVVDIVYHLFDTNQDGNLSTDEFVRVLHKRERDIGHPVETGMLGLLSCCWKCKENISSSRLFSS